MTPEGFESLIDGVSALMTELIDIFPGKQVVKSNVLSR